MFIYRIYNIETQESYIGQTNKTIDYRFKEHIREAKQSIRGERQDFSYFHRMLIYYGTDKFNIELLEETTLNDADEREMYWINYFDSYYNGYNSTKGGQKRSTNELMKENYDKWKNLDKTIIKNKTKFGGMNIQDVIAAGLYNPNGNSNAGKKVGQFNLKHELIQTFPAASIASKETGISAQGIRRVCNGQLKTSGGYIWKWL